MEEYYGSIRVTNPRTLQAWKDKGWYQEQLDKGYIYAPGCGRFVTEKCTCWKCRRKIKQDVYDSMDWENEIKNG